MDTTLWKASATTQYRKVFRPHKVAKVCRKGGGADCDDPPSRAGSRNVNASNGTSSSPTPPMTRNAFCQPSEVASMPAPTIDRKRGVEGKSGSVRVDIGGGRNMKKKRKEREKDRRRSDKKKEKKKSKK